MEVKIVQTAWDLAFHALSPKEKMESECLSFSMPLIGMSHFSSFLRALMLQIDKPAL